MIRPLPSTSLCSHYSLVTLSFDTIWLALPEASSDQVTKQILTMATVKIAAVQFG
jgi:hypothetical protein